MLKEYPQFVALEKADYRCAMRLTGCQDGLAYYYRDGGEWGCFAQFHGDVLKVVVDGVRNNLRHLNGMVLVPVTIEEWRESNGQYAPFEVEEINMDERYPLFAQKSKDELIQMLLEKDDK